MFNVVLFIFAMLYFVELVVYALAAKIARRTKADAENGTYPLVSIVIAAKDEEQNLPACLTSVIAVDYPKELLEVIVVNDDSKDGTASVIDRFAGRNSFVRRVDAVQSDLIRGKANALSQGIDSAKGEFVFLTDADCTVPTTWIKGTLRHFGENTGIVGGVTLISRCNNVITGIQALDWDFLLTLASAAATMRKPLACLGNNLAFRKKAYEDVGGYRQIKFSVTEDYALFKAITSSRSWTYSYPMDRATLVETLPVKTLGQVFGQRRRWAVGGKDTGIFGIVTLAPGFFFHWLILLSAIFSPAILIPAFIFKTLVDALFVIPILEFYGKIRHLTFMLYFEIYYLNYVALLPFSVYLGRAITWKGRKY